MNEHDPLFIKVKMALDNEYKDATLKKKDELIKNLKPLGNKFLGMFGLSTDNFKM